MGNFLKKAGRVILVLFILVLIGVSAALGIAFFLKNQELNNIYSEYNQATTNLNKSDKENQITIGNLQDSYKDLNQKVTTLTQENDDLKKKILQDGFGAIKGTILPFLVGDSTLGQYQLVCARNVNNGNLIFCVSVSALDPKFTLSLPEGSYYITSSILSADGKSTLANYQASYTDYIQCVAQSGVSKCDKTKLIKTIQVDIAAGKTIENVNPTDWTSTKPTP
ncbi:MAG: hypothetical protein ACMG57_00405 [Candidatus Dojkabacteria bacterium]